MDLKAILEGIDNADSIIKRINEEIGKEFVSRADFNQKNTDLKNVTKELNDLKSTNANFDTEKSKYEKEISELNNKVKNYELKDLKVKHARENGLPYEMVNRIIGEDEETISADAKSLADIYGKNKPTPPPKDPKSPVKAEGVEGAMLGMLENLGK